VKVAIIGAGNVGKALGSSITRAGHHVVISASSPDSAAAAAREIGADAAATNVEAVREADVVVLAVPYVGAGQAVADEIAEAVADRVVVDVTNPIKPDYSGLATDGTSAAEELQRRLPGARVVKAFNTIFASNQASPSPEIDAFVAADDADAKQAVIGLVDAMGFTPVDVGALQAARYLEGMAWLNIGLNAANGWSWSSAWRLENKG
jgi:predicted dinucleotide-binding enzyme